MTFNSHSNFSLKRPQLSPPTVNREAPPDNLEVHEWVAADDLSQLQAITNFNLSNCNIQDFNQAVMALCTMPNLKSLYLNLHDED